MIKEIWLVFYNSIKEKCKESWNEARSTSKTSFQHLKKAMIELVTGIFQWLNEFIINNGKIIISLLTSILTAFGKMLLDIVKLWYDLAIGWINKW